MGPGLLVCSLSNDSKADSCLGGAECTLSSKITLECFPVVRAERRGRGRARYRRSAEEVLVDLVDLEEEREARYASRSPERSSGGGMRRIQSREVLVAGSNATSDQGGGRRPSVVLEKPPVDDLVSERDAVEMHEGVASLLRRRGRSVSSRIGLLTFTSLLSLNAYAFPSSKSFPSIVAPLLVPWESVRSVLVQLSPSDDKSSTANAFLLGLLALERGGQRTWDPRTPTSSIESTPASSVQSSPSPSYLPLPPLPTLPRSGSDYFFRPSAALQTPEFAPTVNSVVGEAPRIYVQYQDGLSKSFDPQSLSPTDIMYNILTGPLSP